ncbi:hypothetical protein PTTG_27875 [Puccinia triticina 1-1 BBBD Race 1]|uniref:Uncharacterized protein n=1 Tax=Puccinia triticina (isolate 1-1 / race 1 (BBBD)) TaxID=630390 RepID=A0A180GG87_PUCT1|nr:hypothetical protein PTTG_27875 [Puccinia triticina 1-1 BBBD Race 1]
MHEAAISIGEKQQVDSAYQHIDINDKHEQIASQTRMSIANLLNPIQHKDPALSADFLAERSEDKQQLAIMSSDGGAHKLNCELMIELRKEHDTQNQHRHSGNEKVKQKNFF